MALDTSRSTFTKDPDATLDYVLDLTDWLEAVDDNLAHAEAVGQGVTVESVAVFGKTVVVWVSGGEAYAPASVSIKFTTANNPPRVDERTLKFRIRQR